jgi:pyrimidine-nucleoside phosphorylase
MNTVSIIRKKRDGETLSNEEIQFLVNSYAKKEIPDYQFSSFLMAVYFNSMDVNETAALTEAMLYSGTVIDLSDIKGVKVDKHSTGGVGDKTSLIIAPIAASTGVNVPMISGRGLGHTGGTLDKLESIPGFRTDLNLEEYKKVLRECGAVLIGQTKEIAPADKDIYALRDVTATVESIPLITASIMSKKLAEGIDGLVLDVKTGSGAFMVKQKDAELLAQSLISTAKSFNKNVVAFITDMNQPLGNYIGNWLEVYESVKVLRGEVEGDITELSLVLAGAMICFGGKAGTIEEGKKVAEEQIANGEAYRKFLDICRLQGGDITYIEDMERYPKAAFKQEILSPEEGYLNKLDNFAVGMAAVELGAGRIVKEESVDPLAGIIFRKKIGDYVERGEVIAEAYTSSEEKFYSSLGRIYGGLKFSEKKVRKPKLIKTVIK